MTTLVLTQRNTQDTRHLEVAAAKQGWNIHRALRMSLPEDLPKPITVFGDIAFCDVVAETYGLGLLETSDDWLPNLNYRYLQREVTLITHRELESIKSRKFIKPANDKVFQAGIFERGSHVPYREIRPNAPVLVSEVVDFDVEVRCHILDRRVVTTSIYQGLDWTQSSKHEAEVLASAEDWIQVLLDDPKVNLPSAIVVDIGRISDVGWAVIEANQAYASGVYAGGYHTKEGRGADPEQVLRVVQRSAQSLDQFSLEDLNWVRSSKSRS